MSHLEAVMSSQLGRRVAVSVTGVRLCSSYAECGVREGSSVTVSPGVSGSVGPIVAVVLSLVVLALIVAAVAVAVWLRRRRSRRLKSVMVVERASALKFPPRARLFSVLPADIAGLDDDALPINPLSPASQGTQSPGGVFLSPSSPGLPPAADLPPGERDPQSSRAEARSSGDIVVPAAMSEDFPVKERETTKGRKPKAKRRRIFGADNAVLQPCAAEDEIVLNDPNASPMDAPCTSALPSTAESATAPLSPAAPHARRHTAAPETAAMDPLMVVAPHLKGSRVYSEDTVRETSASLTSAATSHPPPEGAEGVTPTSAAPDDTPTREESPKRRKVRRPPAEALRTEAAESEAEEPSAASVATRTRTPRARRTAPAERPVDDSEGGESPIRTTERRTKARRKRVAEDFERRHDTDDASGGH